MKIRSEVWGSNPVVTHRTVYAASWPGSTDLCDMQPKLHDLSLHCTETARALHTACAYAAIGNC